MAIADLWYKNAIIYCLDVEKYQDANGDGVGDFEGLMRRLDYLQGLAVTCVWLQPFYPSPNRDNGYVVVDFFGVHEKHGSLGERLGDRGYDAAAIRHGLRVRHNLPLLAMRRTKNGSGLGRWRWGLSGRLRGSISFAVYAFGTTNGLTSTKPSPFGARLNGYDSFLADQPFHPAVNHRARWPRYLHLEQRCAGDGNGPAGAVRRDRGPSVIVNLSVTDRGSP
jgi:hypothetical protein